MSRKYYPIKMALLFISTFFLVFKICFPSSVKKEECDFVELFKAEKYKDIIELSGNTKVKNECEKLLLAKSFERLGFYSRSNKIFKELYNQNSKYRDYAAYFIAVNFEKHEDYAVASRWYRNILLDSIAVNDPSETPPDKIMITISAMEKLSVLSLKDRTLLPQILRTLKKVEKSNYRASYYIGLLYHKIGNMESAADYFIKIINDEQSIYLKDVLERVTGHFRLIEILSDKGIDKTYLINLCISNKMYDSALIISYLLPYNSYAAHLRAYCFFKNRDYESAVVMYEEYYTNFKDNEALVQIAYSYFHIGRKQDAGSYMKKYLEIKGDQGSISADAFYLKLQLQKNGGSLSKYIRDSEFFVKNYSNARQTDSFIQDTFYFVLHKKKTQMAVSFLKNTYAYIKDPEYKAWAMYILGIYFDKSFLTGVLNHAPGSYNYYMALENVDVDRKLIRTADRYWNEGRFDEAMDIYTPLFSRGVQKEYIQNKTVHVLSTKLPYKYIFELEKMLSGTIESILVEFYNFGLYDEVKNLGKKALIDDDLRQKIIYYYLVSKISYKNDEIYAGILYAEKLVTLTGKKYLLFFPADILKLLYPYHYQTVIRLYLDEISSDNFNTCFVLSIIREESRFNTRAVSPVGALGLMQLMPDTADWVNKDRISKEAVFDPVMNIKLGILYLKFLDERFAFNAAVLSAYNGGPGNVKKWLSYREGENTQQYIEEIPFDETRNYVKKVLTSYTMYKMLYGANCK